MSDRMNNFINNSIIAGACIAGAVGFFVFSPGTVVPLAVVGGVVGGFVAGVVGAVACVIAGAVVLAAGSCYGLYKGAEFIYNNSPSKASCVELLDQASNVVCCGK